LYFGDPGFDCCAGDELSLLSVLAVLLSTSRPLEIFSFSLIIQSRAHPTFCLMATRGKTDEDGATACFHMPMLKVSREYGMVKNCGQ
jgi:hypothetical protein